MRLLIVCLRLLSLMIFFSSAWVFAEDPIETEPAELVVIDPYIEVHSGPGRGYPIFYVIEWGEKVTIITRRPDWYEVKLQNGKVGWTHSSQISRTIQTTGEPADLPTVTYGDYLKDRWRTGFTVGGFNQGELAGSELFSFALGYRPYAWLGVEGELGELFGSDVKGSFRSLNLLVEPFSKWKWSPFIMAGTGVITIDTQPKLVPLNIDDSKFTQIGLGVNYYIGRNFIFTGCYRTYNVTTEKADERLQAWALGFNTFF